MAEFSKIIFLNKAPTGRIYLQPNKTAIADASKYDTVLATTSSAPLSLKPLTESETRQTKWKVLSIQRLQLRLHPANRIPAVRDNIEDIFPRAVKLFMVNYYFKPEYKCLSKEKLLNIAEGIQIKLIFDDVRFIEEITQDRKSWYWQKLRAGRVTSSNFKFVCEASHSDPDVDLLTEICYPEKYVHPSDAASQTERVAMSSFIVQMKKLHKNFNFKKTGLIVDQNCPYFAASPSGLCSCDCCGKYLVEIKCPFGAATKCTSVDDLVQMGHSFMEIVNGVYCLRQDHQYYYQLQMQMAIALMDFFLISKYWLEYKEKKKSSSFFKSPSKTTNGEESQHNKQDNN